MCMSIFSALPLPWFSAVPQMLLKEPRSEAKYSPYYSSPGAEEKGFNEEL